MPDALLSGIAAAGDPPKGKTAAGISMQPSTPTNTIESLRIFFICESCSCRSIRRMDRAIESLRGDTFVLTELEDADAESRRVVRRRRLVDFLLPRDWWRQTIVCLDGIYFARN